MGSGRVLGTSRRRLIAAGSVAALAAGAVAVGVATRGSGTNSGAAAGAPGSAQGRGELATRVQLGEAGWRPPQASRSRPLSRQYSRPLSRHLPGDDRRRSGPPRLKLADDADRQRMGGRESSSNHPGRSGACQRRSVRNERALRHRPATRPPVLADARPGRRSRSGRPEDHPRTARPKGRELGPAPRQPAVRRQPRGQGHPPPEGRHGHSAVSGLRAAPDRRSGAGSRSPPRVAAHLGAAG